MIGVFDSGIGGLTVLRVLRRAFPKMDFFYLGDTARVPYGSRSEETIREYITECVEIMKSRGVSAIVVACNTASAVGRDIFEASGLPVVDVIGPTVDMVRKSGWRKVAVIGTRATMGSHVYARRLHEIGIPSVREVECPLFVPLIEEGFESHQASKLIAESYLLPISQLGLEGLILGCTHYPFMAQVIGSIVGSKVKLVESGPAVLETMREMLLNGKLPAHLPNGGGRLTVALTDVRASHLLLLRRWLQEDVSVEKV